MKKKDKRNKIIQDLKEGVIETATEILVEIERTTPSRASKERFADLWEYFETSIDRIKKISFLQKEKETRIWH